MVILAQVPMNVTFVTIARSRVVVGDSRGLADRYARAAQNISGKNLPAGSRIFTGITLIDNVVAMWKIGRWSSMEMALLAVPGG